MDKSVSGFSTKKVRDWIVGKLGIKLSQMLYSTCMNES